MIILLLFIYAYFSQQSSRSCIINHPIFTEGTVSSVILYSRGRQITYKYSVNNIIYQGSTSISERFQENQVIKIVYCKLQPNVSVTYSGYLLLIK